VNDLLKLAIEAHGGLTRWNRLAAVEARLSISGVKFLGGDPAQTSMDGSCRMIGGHEKRSQ
jgi:hypothetical protein